MPILARILKDRGIVTERQMEAAIQHQVLYGGRLGTSLYELGFITEERLQEALAKAHGVPSLPVDLREVDPQAVALLSRQMVSRYKIFPYRIRGKTLFLMMVDPNDHEAVARVGFSLGYIVRPIVVPEFRMIQLLKDYYGVDERWRFADTHRPASLAAETLDAATAAQRIEAATTRDEVAESVIALCHRYFRRVLFFIVREPWLIGWSGLGEGVDQGLVASLRIALDQPSVFRTVTRDKTVFVGRFGPEPENERFLKTLGKRPGTNAFLFPIAVKTRVVNLVYGDAGASGNVKARLGELLVLLQRAPRAYMRIIRQRIVETRKVTGDANDSVAAKESWGER